MKMIRKMTTNSYLDTSPSWNANSPGGMENLSREINATVPEELRFNQNALTVVLVYSALFVVAAVGNLTVFISLFRSRHRKSRISLMIRHLALADLVVTFIMIPIEIAWRITVRWIAGNVACKFFLFLRAFGLYLSSNVLVCVSLDRYFAVLHPLKVNDARRRGKFMLACAWGISLLYSVPQSIVFHVSPHPEYPYFEQCVTFGFFTSRSQEVAYNLFCVIVMYFIPLLVIVVAYTAIMCEISNKSKETKGETHQTSKGRMRLRRSDMSNIERARSRTLRMTITIVLVFVWCWTPYVVMTLWYMFDEASAKDVPNWLQNALFMMAVSNSCMNPLVYGSYAINFRKEFCKCLSCFGKSTNNNDIPNGDERGKPGQGGIARRVIKCVLTLQKVRSGTRSTAVIHGPTTVNHSPTRGTEVITKRPSQQLLPEAQTHRTPSMDRISFLSEPRRLRSIRCSFNSEPLPCCISYKDTGGVCSHSSAELSSTIPDTL